MFFFKVHESISFKAHASIFFLKYMIFLSGNTCHINRSREIVPTNKYKIRSPRSKVPTACNSA